MVQAMIIMVGRGRRLLLLREPTIDMIDCAQKYEQTYVRLQSLISGISENEAHDILNDNIIKGCHDDIYLGLLIGILVDPSAAARYYRDLTFVNRDGFSSITGLINQIILEKYLRLHEPCRVQLIWLLRELIKNAVQGADVVCINLLRQIAGGDISTKNMWLAEAMLETLVDNKPWLERHPSVVASSVYTYLRLLMDHLGPGLATLRQREVDFCVSLLRERFADCMTVGRDLVRVLQNVARVPEMEKLWKEMLHNPTSLHSTFTGIQQLLTTRTSRRFLQSRLTPDMERKIHFLTTQVKFGQHKRYQDWFQRQYLSTPESQSLRCDLIRYICGCIHPSNEVLCSEIIPRWAVIGWLLTTCTSNVAASNAKLSLFYDWLFFDPKTDNIMHIEPGILVMHFSMRPHPAITATLLDFLCRIMPNFCIPLTAQVRQGVYTSLRHILEKKVLPNLSSLFSNPKIDKELRAMIKESFPEFCSPIEAAPRPPVVNGLSMVPAPRDEGMGPTPPELADMDILPTANSLANDSEAQFSEDEDDIPLGKLKYRETKFRPIQDCTKLDSTDISSYIHQLNADVKKHVINLQNEKDGETSCEIMDELVQKFLQEDDYDQDSATNLGICLAQILSAEFSKKIFPQEITDESIEDSIGTPLFVLLRNLCQTPEEDPNRQPLLLVLAELWIHHPRVGYLLLYYMQASRLLDTSGYTDFLKSQANPPDLLQALLTDLKLCQEDDLRMFCYILPYIYTQFRDTVTGNVDLLHLVVSCIDPRQLQDLICHVLKGDMAMFKKDAFLHVINASLEWESWEQFSMWQLAAAHNIPLESILPVLNKLEFKAHAEALSSILLILIKEKETKGPLGHMYRREEENLRWSDCCRPCQELLRPVLCREVVPGDNFSVSLLKYWSQEHEEDLAELMALMLNRATPHLKRKRQTTATKNNASNVAPSMEQTLAHLDQLRQHSKEITFFNLGSLQLSLIQIQNFCNDAQKTNVSLKWLIWSIYADHIW
ncbi:INTS3 [Cordylochernes scorpioides]|uniref:SOSS complex subunit A homolog n=1 Tax=Cordylochernes scorpioides TaxID=51811 RepID=A0ABY6L7L9_9ARAC|nr:INTS3 [Cordylochernes scorpioides]